MNNKSGSHPNKLILWRGLHDLQLLHWIDQAWKNRCQLVIVPPTIRDFSFLKKWKGKIQYEGSWLEELKLNKLNESSEQENAEEGLWPEDTVIGLFTSGTSSGTPRLSLFTKENLLYSLTAIRELFNVKKIEQIFCYPQPTHVFGLVLGYLQSYLYQIPLIIKEGPYSRECHQLWLTATSGNKNTLTLGTPAHFSDLISWVSVDNNKVLTTYSCIVGGAPVTVKLWHQLQSQLMIESPSVGYGATEASLGISHLAPGVIPFCDSSIGELLSHVKIHRINEEGFSFSGPNVATAIWQDSSFVKQKEFTLRDIITEKKISGKSQFIFEGRSDWIINRGGLKLSPESIESSISSEFGVDVVTIAYPNSRLGQEVAFILETDKSEKVVNKLIQFIANQFGFRPSLELLVFAPIPKTDNGKKDRLEALKIIIKNCHSIETPLPVILLKDFLPHKGTAIWVDRLIKFAPRFGQGIVELKRESNYWENVNGAEGVSCSASVEWIAQIYGYSKIANEIYGFEKKNSANKTLIAEVKSLENLCPESWEKLTIGEQLELVVRCTHDFAPLFIVEGHVALKEKVIAKLNMKVYAGA